MWCCSFAASVYPVQPQIDGARHSAYILFAARYEDGSLWAKTAVQQNPDYAGGHRVLMACHAMAGRVEEARHAWAVAQQIDPTQRISAIIKRSRFRRPKDIQLFAEAYQIAGMPE
jgi:adenylate cyclase